MDSAVFAGATTADAAAAAERLWSAIEEVRTVGGLGVLDWHVRASYPGNREYRAWAQCYQATLQRLADASDVWVTDLRSLEAWWSERERALGADQ